MGDPASQGIAGPEAVSTRPRASGVACGSWPNTCTKLQLLRTRLRLLLTAWRRCNWHIAQQFWAYTNTRYLYLLEGQWYFLDGGFRRYNDKDNIYIAKIILVIAVTFKSINDYIKYNKNSINNNNKTINSNNNDIGNIGNDNDAYYSNNNDGIENDKVEIRMMMMIATTTATANDNNNDYDDEAIKITIPTVPKLIPLTSNIIPAIMMIIPILIKQRNK